MDYRNIFREKDAFTTSSYVCSYFRLGGPIHVTRCDDYPMLFVLAGSVTLSYGDHPAKTILAGEMVIVNRRMITAVWCPSGTILMEYTLPKELTARFRQDSACFTQPFQPSIPITGRLETWVEQLIHPCLGNHRPQEDGLLELLVKYQKHRLKTICEIIKSYIEQQTPVDKRKYKTKLGKQHNGLPKLI